MFVWFLYYIHKSSQICSLLSGEINKMWRHNPIYDKMSLRYIFFDLHRITHQSNTGGHPNKKVPKKHPHTSLWDALHCRFNITWIMHQIMAMDLAHWWVAASWSTGHSHYVAYFPTSVQWKWRWCTSSLELRNQFVKLTWYNLLYEADMFLNTLNFFDWRAYFLPNGNLGRRA